MNHYLTLLACVLVLAGTAGCKKHHNLPKVSQPAWQVDNTGKYPVSMTAVVQVPEKLLPYIQDDDRMGAFVGEECRGVGQLVRTGTVSGFFVLIHGTPSEESKISFRYWNAWRSNMYTTTAFLDFTVDGIYGSADNPAVLALDPVKGH